MIASESFISDCSMSTIRASSIAAASTVRNRVAIEAAICCTGDSRPAALRPRQRGEMRLDAVELKRHRARIVRIEHDKIDDRRARRDHDVALPIGDLAVGKFEQQFEAAIGRAGPAKLRTSRPVRMARSMRRPSSRKRQPASWVMFSCASPESDEMIRNAASTRSMIALSEGPTVSGSAIIVARSLIARHASGEKRSRITEAADRAAPVESRQRSTQIGAREHRARDESRPSAASASFGTASQASSSEPMPAMTGAAVSSASAARLIMARISRSVASARST